MITIKQVEAFHNEWSGQRIRIGVVGQPEAIAVCIFALAQHDELEALRKRCEELSTFYVLELLPANESLPGPGVPFYYTGAMAHGVALGTKSINEAVKFSKREHANFLLDALKGYFTLSCVWRVTEHQWVRQ